MRDARRDVGEDGAEVGEELGGGELRRRAELDRAVVGEVSGVGGQEGEREGKRGERRKGRGTHREVPVVTFM